MVYHNGSYTWGSPVRGYKGWNVRGSLKTLKPIIAHIHTLISTGARSTNHPFTVHVPLCHLAHKTHAMLIMFFVYVYFTWKCFQCWWNKMIACCHCAVAKCHMPYDFYSCSIYYYIKPLKADSWHLCVSDSACKPSKGFIITNSVTSHNLYDERSVHQPLHLQLLQKLEFYRHR